MPSDAPYLHASECDNVILIRDAATAFLPVIAGSLFWHSFR